MSSDVIKVPLDRPPGWVPAWGEKYPDIRVRRVLDLADMLADLRCSMLSAEVSADPELTVQIVEISDSMIRLHVSGGDAGAKHPIRFLVQLSNGDQDEVVAYQPVRAAAPSGLVSVAPLPGNDNTLLLLVL